MPGGTVTDAGRDQRRQPREVLNMLVTVLSDSHLNTADLSSVPSAVLEAIADADAVIHAGDITSMEAFGALRSLASPHPFHAVLGNNDHSLNRILPITLEMDLGEVTVAVLHDAGQRQGRAGRLRRRFATATVVIFGHSHEPCDEIGEDGQLMFNPGSPTQRRMQPRPTFGQLVLERGHVAEHRIIQL